MFLFLGIIEESLVNVSTGSIILDQTQVDYLSKTIDEKNQSIWSFESISVTSNKYSSIIKGVVLHIRSLEDLYIQLDKADETLMNMKIEPGDKYEKPPRVGTICIAYDQTDNQYYRAKLLEIIANANTSINVEHEPSSRYSTDAKVRVLYIDFGNIEKISGANLYKISPALHKIEPLACHCKLNFSSKLKSWIDRIEERQKISEILVKCLKNLTSKSQVEAKILETRESKSLVDLFIDNDNVCDKLLLNAIGLYKPVQVKNVDSSKSILEDFDEFEAYLINSEKDQFFNAKSNITEIKALNVSMLNNLSDIVTLDINKNIVKDEIYSLAPLPDKIKEKFNINYRFGRVFVHTTDKKSPHSAKESFVNFIYLDYQKWIEKYKLINGNEELSNVPPCIEKFNLNLNNNHYLTRLTNHQLMHLNEIFKKLIFYDINNDYEMSNSAREITDSSGKYSCSTKLKARVFQTNNTSFSNIDNAELRSVRLIDEQREHLDINYVIEKCIFLMVRDFKGHVIHLDQDFKHFDCVNKASNDIDFINELNKIYRSTGLFENEKTTDEFDMIKPGKLCLVDCQKTLNSCMDTVSTAAEDESKLLERWSNSIYRCIFLREKDEDKSKCQVYNVENGKQITILKRKLRSLDSLDNILSDRRHITCALITILPFMVIKAKPDKEIKDQTIKKSLRNSFRYSEKIKINILRPFSSSLGFKSDDNNENTSLATNSYSQFIQTEKDLFKIVDLKLTDNEYKYKGSIFFTSY